MTQHVSVWWPLLALALPLRGLLHRPDKLLKTFLPPGSLALDLGYGQGHFSLGMARLVGPEGRVVALDPDEKTPGAVLKKAERAGYAGRIEAGILAPPDYGLDGLKGEVDFGLCFYLLHRIEDKRGFLAKLRRALRPGARLLLAEPTYHVKRDQFVRERAEMLRAGFVELSAPRMRFSHTALYSG